LLLVDVLLGQPDCLVLGGADADDATPTAAATTERDRRLIAEFAFRPRAR
jgi:hypothetical protein